MWNDESEHEFGEGPAGHVEHEPSRRDRRRYGDDDDSEFAESDTAECRACGAEIFADSPQCAVCGHYPTAAGSRSLPRWVLATALLVVLVLVFGLLLSGW